MKIISRVLCATDFSDSSTKAVQYAEQLCVETGAELYLVHAFDTPETYTLSGQEHPRDPRLQQQLESILADSTLGAKLHRLQHAGPAGDVICWLAQDHECDLIVMGTHGRTGLKHLLFGSVAEHVLTHARCPVLTIRDRDPSEPRIPRPMVLPIMAPRFM
ncbi:MAG: universal stress protein [Planctomycetes bacterium]|nr:universal stress protein [Planctomycetota bacterium]